MKREDVKELHYIAPIENLASIFYVGLLSNRKAQFIRHRSVAEPSVQARRSRKIVDGGLPLHHYVNLYFNAFNPMLSRRRDFHTEIAVLAVSPVVLEFPNVVITDGNAASGATAFFRPDIAGFSHLRYEDLHSAYWTRREMDEEERAEVGRRRCAEVLVPEHIASSFISRVYCSTDDVKARILSEGCTIEIVTDAALFFLPKERPKS